MSGGMTDSDLATPADEIQPWRVDGAEVASALDTSPKTGLDWGFSLLLFPLHVLGELIKPVSLSLRLFGNIFGEDTLVATMVILGYLITQLIFGDGGFVAYLPGVPLQLPFYFLGLLSSTIQALVFTLLATVYIALWLPHGDHDHQDEALGH